MNDACEQLLTRYGTISTKINEEWHVSGQFGIRAAGWQTDKYDIIIERLPGRCQNAGYAHSVSKVLFGRLNSVSSTSNSRHSETCQVAIALISSANSWLGCKGTANLLKELTLDFTSSYEQTVIYDKITHSETTTWIIFSRWKWRIRRFSNQIDQQPSKTA